MHWMVSSSSKIVICPLKIPLPTPQKLWLANCLEHVRGIIQSRSGEGRGAEGSNRPGRQSGRAVKRAARVFGVAKLQSAAGADNLSYAAGTV